MERPLVSIIIPCYNAEDYVRKAIESALHQTCDQTEVIVVDDGSTDDSRAVIASFDEHITWRATDNEGACAARNLGICLASGTFVKFLDADDVLTSRAIEEQVDQSLRFDARERVIVYGHHGKMKEDGTGKRAQDASRAPEPAGMEEQIRFLLDNNINTQCPLHRRAFLREVGGFDERLEHAQEYDFHLRLCLAGLRFCYRPTLTGFLRQHHGESRISNQRFLAKPVENNFAKSRRQLAQFEEHVSDELLNTIQRSMAQSAWRNGREALQKNIPDVAHSYFKYARNMHPEYLSAERSIYAFFVSLLSPRRAEEMVTTTRRLKQCVQNIFPIQAANERNN